MIVCVDVDYGSAAVVAALVGFHAWADEVAALELVDRHDAAPAPYTPGAFFERELPYVAEIVARVTDPIEVIVIDGYVWLGPERRGLGVYVHERCGAPVIGVAKSAFAGASAVPVVRGESARPLFVTAIGIDAALAAEHVRGMHGAFRIPTLIKRADSLARGHVKTRTDT